MQPPETKNISHNLCPTYKMVELEEAQVTWNSCDSLCLCSWSRGWMLRPNVVDCYQVPELFIMDSPVPTSPTHISVNKSLLNYYILSVPLLPLEDLINKFFDHFWKIFQLLFHQILLPSIPSHLLLELQLYALNILMVFLLPLWFLTYFIFIYAPLQVFSCDLF